MPPPKKNKKPENRWKRKKGKDRVDSEKIGIYKTPVRPIKQRPIPSGDRDGSRQTCSVKTASRQLTGNWCTAEDDCNSGRLDAGAVLCLHDGSKVLRSLPWDLHGCKAADEIPVCRCCARVRLPALAPDCIGHV